MRKLLQWFRPRLNAERFFSSSPDETKGSQSPFVAIHDLADAGWSGSGYTTMSRVGFADNPVVYRCVRMISEAAASLSWLLYDGEDELTKHPLLELLQQPNERSSGQTLMESFYGHLLISGNAYLQIVSVDELPRELYLLRPDRIPPIGPNTLGTIPRTAVTTCFTIWIRYGPIRRLTRSQSTITCRFPIGE